jgi:predicted alpha/beta hydrolase
MASNNKAKSTFNLKGLFVFLLFCLLLATLISTHSRALDLIWAFTWWMLIAVGSLISLWQRWKHPERFKGGGIDQLAVMPHRWRRWILGDSDSKTPH